MAVVGGVAAGCGHRSGHLRASYLYKTYGAGQARTVALWAVVFFAACSAILNMAYYVQAGAHAVVAVPMAIFFPVAITILSYLRGVRDVLDERRERRLAGRLAGQDAGRSETLAMDEQDGRHTEHEHVRLLRQQGLTMREISAQTGIPRSTVGAWLRVSTAGIEVKHAGDDQADR